MLILCAATGLGWWLAEVDRRIYPRPASFRVAGETPFAIPAGTDFVVCHYGLASDWRDSLSEIKPKLLILDEAATIRNTTAERTRTVRELGGSVRHILALSGTPIPNSVRDIWPLLHLISPVAWPRGRILSLEELYDFAVWVNEENRKAGRFHIDACRIPRGVGRMPSGHPESRMPFHSKELWFSYLYSDGHPKKAPWFHGGRYGMFEWAEGTAPQERLLELQRRMLKTVMVRHLKSDVLPELPPKTWSQIPLMLDPLRASLYLGLEHDVTHGGGAVRSQSALRRELGLYKVEGSLAWIRAFLASTQGPVQETIRKLTVFVWHVDVGKRIHKELGGAAVLVNGETPTPERDENVRRFCEDPRVLVYVGNIQSGGTSLNLQGASGDVLFVEKSWIPSENRQAEDRVHRHGQTRDAVNIYSLIAQLPGGGDTLDRHVEDVLEEKRRAIDLAVDGTPAPTEPEVARDIWGRLARARPGAEDPGRDGI